MSDMDNPYQSPEASTETVAPLVSQGGLTETMLKYLSEASPWMRFVGIMGFIGSGFMILGGLITFAVMPIINGVFGGSSDSVSQMISFSGSAAVILYGLYFFGAGTLMFFPAFFTFRFGAKIRSYTRTNSTAELELAFKNNKSLWKFNGILLIVSLAIIPVVIIISIIAIFAMIM